MPRFGKKSDGPKAGEIVSESWRDVSTPVYQSVDQATGKVTAEIHAGFYTQRWAKETGSDRLVPEAIPASDLAATTRLRIRIEGREINLSPMQIAPIVHLASQDDAFATQIDRLYQAQLASQQRRGIRAVKKAIEVDMDAVFGKVE